MKSTEYLKTTRTKDIKVLNKELQNEYDAIQKLRFGEKFRNLKDHSQIKKAKKNIARIYTVLGEKISLKQQKDKNE